MSDPAQMKYSFATLTSDDRRGSLYIAAFLCFTYTSITFLTRVLIKWQKIGLDDAAMLVAQVTCVIQFGLLLASLSAGLAKSFNTLSDDQYTRMAMMQYGSQVVIYISLGFSKLATILLVRRLFPRDMKGAWVTCNCVIGIIIAITLASAMLVSVGCSAASLLPRTPSQTCPGIEARYMAVVICDAITDIILAFIPTYLCRSLQMKVSFKLQVFGVFALRLPLIPLARLFLQTWNTSLRSSNPGIDRTTPLIYQQAQLCLSLVAATIPCIRSFLQSFDTGSGAKGVYGFASTWKKSGQTSGAHQSNSTRTFTKDAYELFTIDKDNTATATSRDNAITKFAPNISKRPSAFEQGSATPGENVELERRSTQESDRKSHQSTQELFIRKDVQWEVRHENARRGSFANTPGLLRLPE